MLNLYKNKLDEKRLLPCPFCGKQPMTYWDYEDDDTGCYNEGYNITCCYIHIYKIFKEEAEEAWNTRWGKQ